MARLCRYLAAHRDRAVTLADLARVAQSSPFTVQRKFTRVLGVSPREYQAQLRSHVDMRRSLSAPGASVTDAIYQAGYGSSSRFYEQAATDLGMSPTRFRERRLKRDHPVCYARLRAGTAAGSGHRTRCMQLSCWATNRPRWSSCCGSSFSAAKVVPDATGMAEQMAAILAAMTDHPAAGDLPLDLRATAFQARVWQALRQIPRGETRSYAELAEAVGQPKCGAGCGRACATNPVAIAVPCHRVIGSDGSLTGYRWGIERKKTC